MYDTYTKTSVPGELRMIYRNDTAVYGVAASQNECDWRLRTAPAPQMAIDSC